MKNSNLDIREEKTIKIKRSKRIALIIGLIVTFIFIIFIGLIISLKVHSSAQEKALQEQLDLGNKYLNELDYDQAVIAYEAAIEIDPMNVDAYLGLADSYVNSGHLDKAIEVLQLGYDTTGDERLRSKLDELELLKQTRESIISQNSETVYESKTYDYVNVENASIGDYVIMGQYEQDNDLSNGTEPLEWVVIDKTDGKMLLVSRYVLDAIPYHHTDEDITWEECSLRAWLNVDFYETTFDLNEQEMITSTVLSTPGNTDWGTSGGGDTQDKVFC